MKPDEVRIDAIVVGERGRTDLGELKELADSIAAVGLLHPVVVTAAHELVAGERRLEAIRSLGWEYAPVTIVNLENAADVLRAELEENTCRKALSAYEADVIRQKREQVLAPKAAERKAQAQGKPRGEKRTDDYVSSPKLGEETDRRTAKIAAQGTGYSGSTLDKVRAIRDAAERGVVKQGKQEVPAPEPVIEVAKEAVENVKQTGAAIDREHQRVQAAIETYVAQDVDVQRARLRKRFIAAMGSAREITLFDAANVAAVLETDERSDVRRLQGDLAAWFEAFDAACGPRLKLAGGKDV